MIQLLTINDVNRRASGNISYTGTGILQSKRTTTPNDDTCKYSESKAKGIVTHSNKQRNDDCTCNQGVR